MRYVSVPTTFKVIRIIRSVKGCYLVNGNKTFVFVLVNHFAATDLSQTMMFNIQILPVDAFIYVHVLCFSFLNNCVYFIL